MFRSQFDWAFSISQTIILYQRSNDTKSCSKLKEIISNLADQILISNIPYSQATISEIWDSSSSSYPKIRSKTLLESR